MNERLLDDSVDDPTQSRKSGIVDAVECAPNVIPHHRDVDIDISTDDGAEPRVAVSPSSNGASGNGASSNGASSNGAHTAAVSASSEDEAIEVSDDEIETTELPPYRAPMPSLLGLSRSIPPTPPSSRPRPPSSASLLPPPRSSRPSYDPWALANKALELKHANTYIAELQELVAFRDARIAELTDNLAQARRRVEDLERRVFDLTSRELDIDVTPASVPGVAAPVSSKPATLPAVSPGVSLSPALQSDEREVPLVTETRPALVLPLPSAEARGMTSSERAEDDGDGLDELASDPDPSPGHHVPMARSGSEDNLQQISGIGPRFEAALRKQGITRLSQIAAWSEADVRQVAKALKIPKSRIVKGRWIEVAREVIGTRAASE